MKKLTISIISVLLVSLFSQVTIAGSATEEEIQAIIECGIDWLANAQWTWEEDPEYPPDGGWGHPTEGERTAMTAFALIKLQDRAYELGFSSPFDPEYVYSDHVISGWQYILSTDEFGPKLAVKVMLSTQDHSSGASGTIDDPDYNGNGYGVKFISHDSGDHHATYSTGCVLLALASTGTPNRPNDGMLDLDEDAETDTYLDLAQEAVEWLAFAQGDSDDEEGAWGYSSINNNVKDFPGWIPDNSNGGYATLGLYAAEEFGCTIPPWVKTELCVWIDFIQNDVDGDPLDGGSGYTHPDDWVNVLKTGNLLLQMSLVGDDSSTPRFQDALDYIERTWEDNSYDPGWLGGWMLDEDGDGLIDEDPRNWDDDDGDGWQDEDGASSHYQAMFCLMKGLRSQDIDLLDIDGDDLPEHDWYQEFAELLVNQQKWDGKWEDESWGSDILDTCWALLTLEFEVEKIDVCVDVKPRSYPNPINIESKGVVSVAICGTEDFDVTTIDPASVMIYTEENGDGLLPIRWDISDVCGPCNDGDDGPDGRPDLVLKYETMEMVKNLDLYEYPGEEVSLMVQGFLKPEYDGTEIKGEEQVIIKYNVKEITIGATGGNGVESIEIITSIAQEEINEYCLENNIRYLFRFDVRDNQGSWEIALENMMYYHENGVNLVVGHPWSGQCEGSLEYANENDMLMMSGSSTSPALGIEDEHIHDALYRLVPSDSNQAKVLARLYQMNGVEQLSILYREDTYSESFMSTLVDQCEQVGIVVVGTHVLPWDPYPDFATILSDVEDELDEYSFESTAVQYIEFYERERDLIEALDDGSYPFLKSLEWYTMDGSNAEWLYQDYPFIADLVLYRPSFTIPDTQEYRAFNEKFFDARGVNCIPYEAATYDSCWVMTEAVMNVRSDDAERVKRELEELVVNYRGASGMINLNVYGDREEGYYDIWGIAPGGTNWKYGTYDYLADEIDWYGPPLARIVAFNRGGWPPDVQIKQIFKDFPGIDWVYVDGELWEDQLVDADMLIMVLNDRYWTYSVEELDRIDDWFGEGDKTIWVAGDSDFGEDRLRLEPVNEILEAIDSVLRLESCSAEDHGSNAGTVYSVLGVSDNCHPQYSFLVDGVETALFHGTSAVIAYDGVNYHAIESGYSNVYTIMTTSPDGLIVDWNPPSPEAHMVGETGGFVLMAIEEHLALNNYVIVTGEAPYDHYIGLYKPELMNWDQYHDNQQGAVLFGNIIDFVTEKL